MKSPMIQAHGGNHYKEESIDVDPERKIAKISLDYNAAWFNAIQLIDEKG